MASKKIAGITVEIGGDTTKLGKAIDGIDKQARGTKNELREVDKALKNAPDSAVLWKQKQELLTKAISESREKLSTLHEAQEQVAEQFRNGEIDDGQYRAFQRELEKAKSDSEELRKRLAETNDSINSLGKEADTAGDKADQMGEDMHEAAGDIAETGDAAEKSGEKLTDMGKLAAGAAAVAAAAAKEAYDAWTEVNAGYETIITKTGAAGRSLEELQGVADRVFTSLPFDMSAVGTAVGEINTRFGSTGDELETLSAAFLKYADINGTDVNSSIDNVSGAMRAYGLDASQAADVLGVLTDVSQKTGISTSSLEGALLSNSATFKEMDLSIAEAAQLLGQFELNGVDTSTALAGLKKAQQNAAAEGVSMSEALAGTVTEIKTAGDETSALQTATDLFGKKGAAAMTQAIREGRFSLDDLSDSMKGMEKLVDSTFESTQKAPDKMKVSLNALKLEGAELASKVLPKAADLLDKVNQKLPELIGDAKKLAPLLTGVGTGFAAWKSAEKVGGAVQTVSKMAGALTGVSGAAGLATVGVAGAAAALIVGTGSYIVASEKARQAHLDEVFDKATEASRELSEKVSASAQEMADMRAEADKAVDSDLDLVNSTQKLWDELQTLVDANGKVKSGYEDRVNYIANELSAATGEEIELVDGQIQKYDELQAKIEETIQKQRAQVFQSDYSDIYKKALKEQRDADERYIEAQERISTNTKKLSAMYQEALEGHSQSGNEHLYMPDISEIAPGNKEITTALEHYISSEKIAEMYGAAESIKEARNAQETIKNELASSQYIIEKYEAAEEAMLSGRYEEAERTYRSLEQTERRYLSDSSTRTEQRFRTLSSQINQAVNIYKAGIADGNNTARETFRGTIDDLARQALDGGLTVGELLSSGIVDRLAEIDGFDARGLMEFANTLGVSFGEVLGGVSAQTAANILNNLRVTATADMAGVVKTALSNFGGLFGGVPKLANGGELSSGRAIVAEAGPELLEVMNGGVRVTPLTRTARNTPVGAGGTVTNNYYYSVNVDHISGTQDYRKIAENLEAERRRVDFGKGK